MTEEIPPDGPPLTDIEFDEIIACADSDDDSDEPLEGPPLEVSPVYGPRDCMIPRTRSLSDDEVKVKCESEAETRFNWPGTLKWSNVCPAHARAAKEMLEKMGLPMLCEPLPVSGSGEEHE